MKVDLKLLCTVSIPFLVPFVLGGSCTGTILISHSAVNQLICTLMHIHVQLNLHLFTIVHFITPQQQAILQLFTQ